MSHRRIPLLSLAAVLALAAVPATGAVAATPSPTPSASATSTASATASPSATETASPTGEASALETTTAVPSEPAQTAAPSEAPRAASAAAPQRHGLMRAAASPYSVIGAIKDYWSARGGASGWLGSPRSNEMPARGGVYQQFDGGTVYWSSATGAHAVHGAIFGKYAMLGYEGGYLGLPVTDESPTAGGSYQRFQGGTMYWSAAGGAHVVRAANLDTYGRLGYERGAMGMPLTDETATSGGVYQRFQGGTIYWSQAGGSHAVRAAVLEAYGRYTYERGRLGMPTTDEVPTRGGVYQKFQGGTIYWSRSTGAHPMWGGIYTTYSQQGWELGIHGFPTSDEYNDRGHARQDFQSGSIWWSGMPSGTYTFNVAWASQPNGFFCGPTTGFMILRYKGITTSRSTGAGLSIENVATAMRTRDYGYTSFNDRRFTSGMNAWIGAGYYSTTHTPSPDTVRAAARRSFSTGYPMAVDEQERRGGPHFNGHSNATFSHIMAVVGYNTQTDAVEFIDSSAGMWINPTGAQNRTFWYPSLGGFTSTYLQHEYVNDGKQHIGIYAS